MAAAPPPSAPAVDVDERCASLPLLELAEDVARIRELTISVREATDLPAEAGGGATVTRERRAWVLLAAGDDEATWAHELAHLVDNIDGRVGARTGRTVARREQFADRLAALLLEHEPTSVASARPLIARARRR